MCKITKDADEAVLDMDIIVNFGTKVQNAAKEVQEKVKTTVETMTGLTVAAVNVSICGIVKETEAKAEEEEFAIVKNPESVEGPCLFLSVPLVGEIMEGYYEP